MQAVSKRAALACGLLGVAGAVLWMLSISTSGLESYYIRTSLSDVVAVEPSPDVSREWRRRRAAATRAFAAARATWGKRADMRRVALQTLGESFSALKGHRLGGAYEASPPAALVIGANIGDNVNDYAFRTLTTSPLFANWTRVFIEPIPSIHNTLKENLKKLALNPLYVKTLPVAVVVSKNDTGSVDMFCWRTIKDDAEAKALYETVGIEYKWWFDQTCSTSRDRLFASYDFAHHGATVYREELTRLIEKHVVPTRSVESLLDDDALLTGRGRILYLQIDVEGLDHLILLSLPFHREDFRPILLTFEDILFPSKEVHAQVERWLKKHRYEFIGRDSQNQFWAATVAEDDAEESNEGGRQ